MGDVNPRAAIGSAIGTAGGYALGRYPGDGSSAWKHARWVGLLGGMSGDLFGAKSLGSLVKQSLWDAGGAVAGGGLAYMRGGDVLAGAQYGMMAASLTKQFAYFAAGPPLLTPEASQPIEQFRVGDHILSRHEDQPDGPVPAKRVEKVFVRRAVIIEMVIGDRVIRTTAEHPFFVLGRGWTPAAELGPGVALVGGDGEVHVVDDLRLIEEPATVYNLSVADFHTYFVGCDEWGFSVWAHNAYSEGVETGLRQRLRNSGLDEATVEHIVSKGRTPNTPETNTLSDRWAQFWNSDRLETLQMHAEMGANTRNIVDGAAFSHGLALADNIGTKVAQAATVRKRVVGIMLANDMNLRTHDFNLHGTSTRITNATTSLGHQGTDFFTTADAGTAMVFAQRNVGKAGGGDLAGVLMLLEAPVARHLERAGLSVTRPIHDMPPRIETIFRSGSRSTANDNGRFQYLLPRFFQE